MPSPHATDGLRLRLPVTANSSPGPAFAARGSGVVSVVLALVLAAGTIAIARTPVDAIAAAQMRRSGIPSGAGRGDLSVPRSRGRSAPSPEVIAPAAIVIDAGTGRVIFAKRPDRPLPIASLAKIMTALVVLEQSDLAETVAVSRRAAFTEPVAMGLFPRERISVRALLYGLLLRSGNDAAVALAEHVSGSVPAFLDLMNQRALTLGLRHTWFASPNGLDDRGYGTARDLAKLTQVAIANATFARIVDTDWYLLRDGRGRPRVLWNINLFRGQYVGAIGVKTGFTSRAGDCLVAAAERGGRTLVAVVLGDSPATHWQDAFGDASRLLDFGFESGKSSPSI